MFYILIVALIVIDQIIKIIVRANLSLGQGFSIIGDLFKITYIENTGMAFGMMSGKSIFLVFLPLVFTIVIYLAWRKYKDKYGKILGISVALILAGGLSNLFDRIAFGSVTDYLDLQHFAIFNFADICATVGCALLCLSIFFFEKKE